ncbi:MULTISPECIES: TonB-dependent receptor domain-containing protein [unclassified Corallococcus]|uniref:TonB-dependent receptor domain-containing protein n=1 Tax=unclassified Corallococcus TaxID=2685029 RepID=UPI001A8F756D|nr:MULTISPECIES: TonB-dependent receptor [unclassified Corallococcus]MBN9681160.1 TonB-dependent receptor [Corallococcus sp. NCSPR001]WAS87259.1 TonB-dependent receptor [Corallococcus sp. NCRR]
MFLPRAVLLALALVLLSAATARAQGVPSATSEPRAVEVDVHATDAGQALSSEDAVRLGLSPDAGDLALVPPSLIADAPAAWPQGLEGTAGEVELELLVDVEGRVAEAKVIRAASEPRLTDAALAAAPGLRFTPATLGGGPVAVRLPFVYRFTPPVQVPASTTRLTGEVRARGTRRPLPDAALFLDGALQPAATTDAQGRFTLDVPPGPHTLEVRAPGHATTAFTETLTQGQTLQVIYRLQPREVNPYETVVRDERPRTEVTRISLHEQELREVPGTLGDPFRVVMLMPGVGSLASGISYPVVRGSQPAATGFFLDGVRIPMLYHLLLGPAVVHPDFIDTVDFYPGAPPVQYGRVLGGAVEGRLSRPREDRLHFTAYADLLNAGGFIEQPFESTGTSVSLAGRFSYSALLLSLAANALQRPDAQQVRAGFWDYQARVEQKVGKGRLRLFALGSSDDVGISPELEPGADGGGVVSRFHRIDLRGTHPVAEGEGEVGVTLGWDGLGLNGEQTRSAGDALVREQVGEYGLRQVSVAARAGWRRALTSSLDLAVGADVEHRRSATTLTGTARPPGWRPSDDADPLKRPSALATFSGAYASATWKPSERWAVTPGLRVDAYHLVPGMTFTAVEPRLSVRHALTDTLTLKGGAGLFHQPPTVLVHVPAIDTASLRYGLQSGAQFDVGAEWKAFEGLELSADAFFNPLSRAVEFDLVDVAENRRRRGSLGEDPATTGYAYGFDLMARHPLGRHWFGWVSYSFLQSKRKARFSRIGDDNRVLETVEGTLPFAFEQAHTFNAALSYKFGNNWTVGTVVHFNTGRPETGQITSQPRRWVTNGDGSPEWIRQDLDRAQRLAPFFRVDARIAKSWAYQDFTLDASLDVLNLSAQQEVVGYDYLAVGGGQDGSINEDSRPLREPIRIPIIVPLLGLKATY